MDCGAIVGSDFPACIECTKNEDCDGKNCDLRIGRCVDKLPEHEEPECCGKDCDVCPEDAPFCLPTHIDAQCSTCRNDMDCPDAEWCKSGVCEPCLDDRRCGPRCDSCGGDEPFCDGAFTGESGVCVRCTENSQCGQDGLCNTDTHVCTPGCSVSCGGDAPYCLGDICVVCYADTQCPCGGTCDLLSHTCSTACTDNSDCQATDHCKWNDEGTSKECGTGQMPDDSTCGGTLATICQGNQIGRKDVNPIPIGGTALAALALLWQRRRNKASSNKRVGGGQ